MFSAVASENAAMERPLYGCQVIVQSEDEKNLRKAMRKEEKKLNKILNRTDEVDITEVDEMNEKHKDNGSHAILGIC